MIKLAITLDLITSYSCYHLKICVWLLLLLTEYNRNKNKEKNIGGVLKFFGIWVFTKQFLFRSRTSLQSTTDISNYIPKLDFSTTEMPFHGFDIIFKCIHLSSLPYICPEVISSEAYWWLLVDDFLIT